MTNLRKLNRNHLKYIAVFAMILDHIAWCFVPSSSLIYFLFRAIGRLTMPIMAFFVAEGYRYTKNTKKYALRLLIFAIISMVPFNLLFKNTLPITIINSIFHIDNSDFLKDFILYFSIANLGKTIKLFLKMDVMYTLFLGLVSLIILESKKIANFLKIVLLFLICIISINGDFSYFTILYVLVFYYFKDTKYLKFISFYSVATFYVFNSFSIDSIYKLGALLVPVILLFYNGESGSKNKFNKWFFYIFYPAHLLILYFIKNCI